jgi:hypothetical protein
MPVQVIKQTTLPNGMFVSTVFLGVLIDECPFETMIFPSEKERRDLAMRRYKSIEDAREGHKQLCEEYKDKPPYPPQERDDFW